MLLWKQKIKTINYFTWMLLLILKINNVNAGTTETVNRLFARVAGYKLPLNDPRRVQMETLVSSGNIIGAAKIASEDDSFFNVTVKQFAAPLSTREEDPRSKFSDFIAMFIGVARDNRDARELLYGDFLYVANTNDSTYKSTCSSQECSYNVTNTISHFATIDRLKVNFRKYLVRISPQRPNVTDAAGVLTTYGWADAHFKAGTNRRATDFALREFLCTSVQELADNTISDDRVRQDVDRAPGGNATTYQTSCRGCHGGMDAMSGAWAHFDNTTELQYYTIRPKYLQNSSVFPSGFITRDNSWVNYFTKNQGASLGWRGALSGYGVSSFGKMLANSQAFSSCMAKRAFKKMCGRDSNGSEQNIVKTLALNFEKNNYNLRNLLEEASIVPACLGQ